MTNLHCTVCDCQNNSRECCCRPDILVSGKSACGCEQTSCSDFRKAGISGAQNSACTTPNRALHVRCEAQNCTYYAGGECTAQAIQVCGASGADATTKSETQCHTFRML